jgi:hypothetical protein
VTGAVGVVTVVPEVEVDEPEGAVVVVASVVVGDMPPPLHAVRPSEASAINHKSSSDPLQRRQLRLRSSDGSLIHRRY